jgi:hypothetical protein
MPSQSFLHFSVLNDYFYMVNHQAHLQIPCMQKPLRIIPASAPNHMTASFPTCPALDSLISNYKLAETVKSNQMYYFTQLLSLGSWFNNSCWRCIFTLLPPCL